MEGIYLLILAGCLVQCCLAGFAGKPGDLRLITGDGDDHSGLLQIEGIDIHWGTICNDTEWTSANTDVACRQLGYLGGAGTVAYSIEVGTPISIRGVNCTGDEWRLVDCPHVKNAGDCEHIDDIQIACIPPGVEACVATEDGAPALSGRVEEMDDLEPGACVQHCRGYGFLFAAVDLQNRCSCGNEEIEESEPFEECRTEPCPWDEELSCVGEDRAVVYDVQAGNCGGRISGKEGTLLSPGHPIPYEAGLTCTWILEFTSPVTKISYHKVSMVEGDQVKVMFPDFLEDEVIPHSRPSFSKSTSAKRVTVVFTSLNSSTGGDGFFLHFQDDAQCEIPDIMNGSLVTEPGKIYRPGERVRMRCDGSLVYSNASVFCRRDGMWFPTPSCDVYVHGLTVELIWTILIMVIVGLVTLGILFALTAVMLACIKANDSRKSGYQGITTEIVEAPPLDSVQEERFTPITKDDIKVQLHDEDGEMDNNANEQQQVSPVAEEDLDEDLDEDDEELDEEGSDAAAAGDDTVEADETLA